MRRVCGDGKASSLCNLCVLCVSVVKVFIGKHSPQRHRGYRGCTEKSKLRHRLLRSSLCFLCLQLACEQVAIEVFGVVCHSDQGEAVPRDVLGVACEARAFKRVVE